MRTLHGWKVLASRKALFYGAGMGGLGLASYWMDEQIRDRPLTGIPDTAPSPLSLVRHALAGGSLGLMHADARAGQAQTQTPAWLATPVVRPLPGLHLWGGNRYGIVQPTSLAPWCPTPTALDGVGGGGRVRDAAMAEEHAGLVDAAGDVWQWGHGVHGGGRELYTRLTTGIVAMSGGGSGLGATGTGALDAGRLSPEDRAALDSVLQPPVCTLRGANVTQLVAAREELIALDGTGRALYRLAGKRNTSPSPLQARGGGGGFLGVGASGAGVALSDGVRKYELSGVLDEGDERVVKMAAGRDHLLLLTSKGRVWSAPLTPNGNYYGQCGLSHLLKRTSHGDDDLMRRDGALSHQWKWVEPSLGHNGAAHTGGPAERDGWWRALRQAKGGQHFVDGAASSTAAAAALSEASAMESSPSHTDLFVQVATAKDVFDASLVRAAKASATAMASLSAEPEPVAPFCSLGLWRVGPEGAQHAHGASLEDVVDVAAGSHHSLLCTRSGHVYGFGCNLYGQLATGSGSFRRDQLFVSSPVRLQLGFPGASHLRTPDPAKTYDGMASVGDASGRGTTPSVAPSAAAVGGAPGAGTSAGVAFVQPVHAERTIDGHVRAVAAAGHTSAFVVAMPSPPPAASSALLMALYTCGAGQFGQLGNGSYRHVMGDLSLVPGLSFLTSWSETAKALRPLRIHDLQGGEAHFAAVLRDPQQLHPSGNDSGEADAMPLYGDSVYMWGANQYYQLGNGRRAMASRPTPPLSITAPDGDGSSKPVKQQQLESSDPVFDTGMQLFPGAPKDASHDAIPAQHIKCGFDTTAIF